MFCRLTAVRAAVRLDVQSDQLKYFFDIIGFPTEEQLKKVANTEVRTAVGRYD